MIFAENMLRAGKIARVRPNPQWQARMMERAGEASRMSELAAGNGAFDTAVTLAHDAVRVAISAVMNRDGYRALGGDGSHITVIAYAEQRPGYLDAPTGRAIGALRQQRRAAMYGPEEGMTSASADTAASAATIARRVVSRTATILAPPAPPAPDAGRAHTPRR